MILAVVPAWPQQASAPAASTVTATPAALTPASGPAGTGTPKCSVAASLARLDQPLTQVAYRLATGLPIRIVAIGSSSTAGAGASSPAKSYPSQLEAELGRHFPGHAITVINRGVNGEEAGDMVARFDADVIAERPHLVLWQVGTNSLLRDRPIDARATVLHAGLARLKEIRTDVVLIDPQFAPRVTAKSGLGAVLEQIDTTASEETVGVFHRFAMMKRWHEVDGLPVETFVSADGLHHNDWSYGCLAKWLGVAIAEASSRPSAAVAGTPTR